MNEQQNKEEISCFVCDKYFICEHVMIDHRVHIKEECIYFEIVAQQGGNTS